MSERMRDLRAPLVVAIVLVAAMFAAFTVTRSDAATDTPQSASPNQTIQSTATPEAQDRDGDGHLCPDEGRGGGGRGHGGPGEQGSSTTPAPQPSAPATTDGTDL